MRLIAIMSFWEERSSWLAAAVSSLAKADVDHLVAVDGPYLHYPDSTVRFRSSVAAYEAIVGAAHGIGIGLTLFSPTGPWIGDEVAKRNFLFDLGRCIVPRLCHEDWFFIIDSDEEVRSGAGTKMALSEAFEDVAYYRLLEPEGTPNYVRGLYRWHPELCLTVTHYGFRHGEQGTLLWDGGGLPAANLTNELVLLHHERDPNSRRNKQKWEYYAARDRLGLERIPNKEEAVS